MPTEYLTTKQVCQRYNVCRQTLYRWMAREQAPFPAPRLRGTAGNNRWALEDLIAYERAMAA